MRRQKKLLLSAMNWLTRSKKLRSAVKGRQIIWQRLKRHFVTHKWRNGIANVWHPRRARRVPALIAADQDLANRAGIPLDRIKWELHYRFAQAMFAFFVPLIAASCLMLRNFSRLGLWAQILLAVGLVIPLQMSTNLLSAQVINAPHLAPLAYVQPLLCAVVFGAVLFAVYKTAHWRPMRQPDLVEGGA
ncbi:hypothetical protein [Marivivens sp.]|uniref:hypothetical protein n=1 Tax=Marivivens sp. TaxID=1978374 RepID=UPI00345B92D0